MPAGPAALRLRPMVEGEAPAVLDLCKRTLFEEVPDVEQAVVDRRSIARLDHPRATDPGGAWIAERDDGTMAGAALALVRERVWGLSLLAVDEDVRSRGVGRDLLDRTLAYGEERGAEGWIIVSSEHPAAMRRYARAGFDLLPAVSAAGVAVLDHAPGAAARVEEAGAAGIATANEITRAVRGAGYDRDLEVFLEQDSRLLIFEDRAFAVLREGNVQIVGGRDPEAAALVTWGAVAAAPQGATVMLHNLTSAQQWAIRVALDAGLALSPDGPLCLRGRLGPMTPYLPSGAWL